jgi:hypothetical protein
MALPKDFSKVDYHEGIVRTECDCTECGGKFIARLNYDIDGDHKIICPRCGHLHYRTIKKGVVTETRWRPHKRTKDKQEFVPVTTEQCWRDEELGAETTTPAEHIRQRYLAGRTRG